MGRRRREGGGGGGKGRERGGGEGTCGHHLDALAPEFATQLNFAPVLPPCVSLRPPARHWGVMTHLHRTMNMTSEGNRCFAKIER
jgi:hypothetical protein